MIRNWPHIMLYLCLTVAGFGVLQPARAQLFDETVHISRNDLQNQDRIIYLTDSWKFNTGDSLHWANRTYDDTDWEQVSTLLGPTELPFIEWNGIGWFRLTIQVDSSLVNQPLSVIWTSHNGASELYLDGEKLSQMGRVSSNPGETVSFTEHIPRSIRFPDTKPHVLAVRYANHNAQTFNELGFTAGFRLLLGDLDHQIRQTVHKTRSATMKEMFYTGGLLAFTVIHFLLFVFYPREKSNLYFSIFTAFLALLSYSEFETYFTNDPMMSVSFVRLSIITWIFTVIYALRFVYSIFRDDKTPLQFWFFLGIGLVIAVLTWIMPSSTQMYREVFVLLTIIEMIRVLILAIYRDREGAWIIGTGLGCFTLGIIYAIGANLNVVNGDPLTGSFYGSIFLIFAMSVYLARNFATINKRLQHKLVEVKEWSERALEQERVNKEKELERKLLEAENERKSKELEEARTLQLSMLPRRVPELDHWDIAVYMDTANEVGGDYYDFSIAKDGTLSVALGDATGHGMKAGIMVATAKSYFHTLADEYSNLEMLKRMSSGIRNMDLKIMYMGLMLLKCRGHSIDMATAGMPPALLYRAEQQEIERITIKGMPLGTKADYPYKEESLKLNPDDTLLLMSDGLMERFNKERDLLGIERIERRFADASSYSSSDILNQLIQLSEQWGGGNSQEDDITLMILKAKNHQSAKQNNS